MQGPQIIMALDVGEKRVGVAIADSVARFASPLTTLSNDDQLLDQLKALITEYSVREIVVGLPRGLEGQETAQTKISRAFNEQLHADVKLPTILQDEAVTSIAAEEKLKASGKPYHKEDIDMYAAAQILEDYLLSHPVKELA
jgi:putative Holliday junction resolvase